MWIRINRAKLLFELHNPNPDTVKSLVKSKHWTVIEFSTYERAANR